MDLSKLSESDLQALANGDLGAVSSSGLQLIAGVQPAETMTEGLVRAPGRALRSAIQGVAALPNIIADPLYRMAGARPPSQTLPETLTALGLPEYPKDTLGRIAEAASEAVAGAGGQIAAARRIAEQAVSPVTRGVAQMAAQAPEVQLGVAAPAAAASQATLEATGSPVVAMAAGLGTGVAAGRIRPSQVEVIPTAEDLAAQAAAKYRQAADAGAIVSKDSLGQFARSVESELGKLGYRAKLHPEIKTVLEEIKKDAKGDQTIDNLEILRRVIKAPAANFSNPDQQRIAKQLVGKFDSYVENLSGKDILAGNVEEAVSALKDARTLYSRNKKSDIIEDLIQKAELSSTQYSQSGKENAIRVQFRQLAKNNTKMAQFTKDEQDQIRKIVKGDTLQNTLRFIGKFSPTGVVSSLPTAGAAAISPLAGIAVPLVSFPARSAAERMGMANIDALTQMIRLGRPAEITRPSLTPTTAMRGLLSSQTE